MAYQINTFLLILCMEQVLCDIVRVKQHWYCMFPRFDLEMAKLTNIQAAEAAQIVVLPQINNYLLSITITLDQWYI